MDYQCVDARFYFWDGKNGFTVEHCYGLKKWFVFNSRQDGNCIFQKEIDPSKSQTPTRDVARHILLEYLDNK